MGVLDVRGAAGGRQDSLQLRRVAELLMSGARSGTVRRMPRKKKASNSTGLGDLKAVISKAAAVYPQLIARRDALHAELREIEEILGAFGGGSAKAAPA